MLFLIYRVCNTWRKCILLEVVLENLQGVKRKRICVLFVYERDRVSERKRQIEREKQCERGRESVCV